MKVIREKTPSIDLHRPVFEQFFQAKDEVLPILIVEKYFPPLNPSPHHMVQNPGGI
jgi:hypothetical protein